MKKIYLDYNATTPVAPEVIEKIIPYLKEKWGNPSSQHWAGDTLKEDIENARKNIASSLNCFPEEIYFTSCGSESDNWALKFIYFLSNKKDKHIITSSVEHPAILETCYFLEKLGIKVTYLPVNEKGELNLELLENSINEKTSLISIMYANNETGVIFPIKEIAKICQNYNILLHIDAVQAYGKIKLDLSEIKPDLVSISGHKVYSPKGIGVLYIKKGLNIEPLIHGGGQEKGLRSGTENVVGIIALGKSAELIIKDFKKNEHNRIKQLRDKLEKKLLENLDNILINGDTTQRVGNTLNVSFKNIEATALVKALSYDGIAVSSGAACATHKGSYSHVLKAMGRTKIEALSSIRVSLGRYTTEEDIEIASNKIIYWVKKLRSFSPEK